MKANHLRQLPAGIKDYLFDEAKRRRNVERCLREVFEQADYREVITPTFEYLEVFGAAGRDGFHEKIYRFVDRDGNLLALRSDFTAQAARIIASKSSALNLPARIYYSGRIFRFEELHAGLSREAWQVGAELFGQSEVDADVEILQLVVRAFESLGIADFQITLGSLEFLDGIVASERLQGEVLDEIKFLLAHKDTDGLRTCLQNWRLSAKAQHALLALSELPAASDAIEKARRITDNARSQRAVQRLQKVSERLSRRGLNESITIDLSETQGLGYYTGITIKAFVHGVGYEVGSGGRYDNLLGQFGFECPAVGFSFDVDRLVASVLHQEQSA